MTRPEAAGSAGPFRSIVPRFERLEGRRLLAGSGPTVVQHQELPNTESNGFDVLEIFGTNKSDVISIDDNGTGTAGNVTVTLGPGGSGGSFTSSGAIDLIFVVGGQGNDRISYDLSGEMQSGLAQTVVVEMGAKKNGGASSFTADVAASVLAGSDLGLIATAVSKKTTTMTVTQSADLGGQVTSYLVPGFSDLGSAYPGLPAAAPAQSGPLNYSDTSTADVAPGGELLAIAEGGSGKNNFNFQYTGVNDGDIEVHEVGGAGADQIGADIAMTSGSIGTVGTIAAEMTEVEGGKGNDRLRFTVHRGTDGTSQTGVYGQVIGDSGNDSDARTANILSLSNETDTVVQ